MRRMTRLATFRFHRRVLEYERTLLVAVTVETHGILRGRRAQLAAGSRVHVMAVRALHQPFVDPMPERLVKVSTDLLVARVTQVLGLIGQQVLIFFRLVDVVA